MRIVTESETDAGIVIASDFVGPEGIAIHPTTGDIYISDTDAHCIYLLKKVEE